MMMHILIHSRSVNGQKVLEYGEKAVKIASSDSALADFTDGNLTNVS